MYLSGFGNHHQTEALSGALPSSQNSPQKPNFGLYAEQISGTAFTRARHLNLHSWLYRILPSVSHHDYKSYPNKLIKNFAVLQAPNPYRWSFFPLKKENTNFIDGLEHIAGNKLANIFIYLCNKSMDDSYFSNHDGELLFVPYKGEVSLETEFGRLELSPGQIAVIPRAVFFTVKLKTFEACGYLCENLATPFSLPNLGFMGANALANPRHFLYPKAAYENLSKDLNLICKYQQNLWIAKTKQSPLSVVAWHGNYAPYLYDLSLFNTINTVSFDHPDPSIFTVLTSESDTAGVANIDFVIFPSFWHVAEHSFRLPYYHRNIMSEFMGLIKGVYSAKEEGFSPGGMSIHNSFTPHGPDTRSYNLMSEISLKPSYSKSTLAFMFETKEPWLITEEALANSKRQKSYSDCWKDLPKNFETD